MTVVEAWMESEGVVRGRQGGGVCLARNSKPFLGRPERPRGFCGVDCGLLVITD